MEGSKSTDSSSDLKCINTETTWGILGTVQSSQTVKHHHKTVRKQEGLRNLLFRAYSCRDPWKVRVIACFLGGWIRWPSGEKWLLGAPGYHLIEPVQSTCPNACFSYNHLPCERELGWRVASHQFSLTAEQRREDAGEQRRANKNQPLAFGFLLFDM